MRILLAFMLLISTVQSQVVSRPTVNPFNNGVNNNLMMQFGGPSGRPQQGINGFFRPTFLPQGATPSTPPNNPSNPPNNPSNPPNNPNVTPTPPSTSTSTNTPPVSTNKVNRINNGYAKGVMVPFSSSNTNSNSTSVPRWNLRNLNEIYKQAQSHKQWRLSLRKHRGSK